MLDLLDAPLVVPEDGVELVLGARELGVAEAGREQLQHELGGDLGGGPANEPRHPVTLAADLIGGGLAVDPDTETPPQHRGHQGQEGGQQNTEERVIPHLG